MIKHFECWIRIEFENVKLIDNNRRVCDQDDTSTWYASTWINYHLDFRNPDWRFDLIRFWILFRDNYFESNIFWNVLNFWRRSCRVYNISIWILAALHHYTQKITSWTHTFYISLKHFTQRTVPHWQLLSTASRNKCDRWRKIWSIFAFCSEWWLIKLNFK